MQGILGRGCAYQVVGEPLVVPRRDKAWIESNPHVPLFAHVELYEIARRQERQALAGV